MIYVLDRFTDKDGVLIQNHTPDIDVEGGGWSVIHGGPIEILSNQLFIPAATDWSAAIDPGVADEYIITGKVIAEQAGGIYARILFRTIDINNWLAFQIEGLPLSGGRQIAQNIAGVMTYLASSAPAPSGVGTYEFKITVNGTLITCEDVTNSIVLTATTSQFQTEQLCGLGNVEESPSELFDDYRIESLPVTPTAPTEVENCDEAVWTG